MKRNVKFVAYERLLRVIFTPPKLTDEEKEKLRDCLEDVFKTLTYREREVIKLRYGLGDGHVYTLEEVARIFKITRERVRIIQASAIRKLQHPVRSNRFKEFFEVLKN